MKNDQILGLKLYPEKPLVHLQLSIMMILQFIVMGCTNPIVSLYMKDYLHFSGFQIGSVLALSAMVSFVAPVVSTFIADRLISAERFLSIVHLLSAVLMLFLSCQTNYYSFLIYFVLYTVALNPAGPLTNAIIFHHLPDSNHFGGIRLWGTIGWIIAAWICGFVATAEKPFLVSNDLHSALQISAYASLLLALYALFLPRGIKKINRTKHFLPTDSFKIFFDPAFLIMSIFSCLIMFIDRFYVFGAAPFLKSIGYAEKDILPILSIGQIPEILLLLIMGVLLKHFGFKLTILAGIALEIFRFLIFALGTSDLFLFSGIIVHGMTWALFFVPITIFIDKKCLPKTRAGIQQLYSFVSGTGVIAGNLISGITADLTTSVQGKINYSHFWLIPLILSIITFIAFAILFKESHSKIDMPDPYDSDEKNKKTVPLEKSLTV